MRFGSQRTVSSQEILSAYGSEVNALSLTLPQLIDAVQVRRRRPSPPTRRCARIVHVSAAQ
jgi:hypothetical protein